MRSRDIQALGFCVLTLAALLVLSSITLGPWIGLGLGILYSAWLLSRPRMKRVMLRLQGKHYERISYYKN